MSVDFPQEIITAAIHTGDVFLQNFEGTIMEMSAIASGIANGTCKVIGRLNENDLATVRRTIVDTGLLSGEEESLFFWDIVR